MFKQMDKKYSLFLLLFFVNIFLPISFNICFRCSKELSHLSHWDSSFEYPQHMFWLRNKINMVLVRNLSPVILTCICTICINSWFSAPFQFSQVIWMCEPFYSQSGKNSLTTLSAEGQHVLRTNYHYTSKRMIRWVFCVVRWVMRLTDMHVEFVKCNKWHISFKHYSLPGLSPTSQHILLIWTRHTF